MNYFTSDLHLGHKNIIKYCSRPFDSIENMDETLVYNWNSKIKDNDNIFVLGDFMMGHDFKERLSVFTKRLNGIKHLILGNHDRKRDLYLEAGFTSVQNSLEIYLAIPGIGLQPILMQHKPPGKLKEYYSYVLCGHVHNLWKNRGYWINVGVDLNDYEPQNFEKLIQGVVRNSVEIPKFCFGCQKETNEIDGICSEECANNLWKEEYNDSRKDRKFK